MNCPSVFVIINYYRYWRGGIVLKAGGKKIILWGMLCCIFLILNTYGASCETSVEIQADEWSWEAGEISYFHGSIRSDRDIPEAKLELKINTGLSESGEISFTVLNGKKLKIRKQGPNAETELRKDEVLTFEGKWLLPYEPERDLQQAILELTVKNGNEEVIASGSLQMGTVEESVVAAAALSSSDRVIPILLAAAALIWLAAVGRHLILNKKTI